MLKNIAECQDISEKYLEQLLAPLKAKGIIHTIRGKQGGYVLTVHPRDLTLYDVLEVVEGSLAPVNCVDNPGICSRREKCVTKNVWSKLKDNIVDELKSIDFDTLARQQLEIQ